MTTCETEINRIKRKLREKMPNGPENWPGGVLFYDESGQVFSPFPIGDHHHEMRRLNEQDFEQLRDRMGGFVLIPLPIENSATWSEHAIQAKGQLKIQQNFHNFLISLGFYSMEANHERY